MTRDLTLVAIIALALLIWFLPSQPKFTVIVSPEIERAALRVVDELPK